MPSQKKLNSDSSRRELDGVDEICVLIEYILRRRSLPVSEEILFKKQSGYYTAPRQFVHYSSGLSGRWRKNLWILHLFNSSFSRYPEKISYDTGLPAFTGTERKLDGLSVRYAYILYFKETDGC